MRKAGVLGVLTYTNNFAQESKNSQVRREEDSLVSEWVEKVASLVYNPRFMKRQPVLPCRIIPGLLLALEREASSLGTLHADSATHVFSCVESSASAARAFER